MHNTRLLKACREDNELLGDFLQENRDFIFSIITKYKGNIEEIRTRFQVDEEELIQHAYIGIVTALRDFDFDRGIKFTTYVVRPMIWEVNQLLYNDSWLVRISRGSIDILGKIKEIESAVGYLPPPEELAVILKVPEDRIQDILRFSGDIDRLEKHPYMDAVDRHSEEESDIVARVDMEQMLADANLDEREREIIDLLINDGLKHSQIAAQMNVYPMTINRAIARIKNKILNADFEDRRISKYESEIELIAEELDELGYLIEIDDMQDLLGVCGYDADSYSPRILYYIRQKAAQRSRLEEPGKDEEE